VVELAPELRVHMTRRGIAAVLPPEADEEDEEVEVVDEGDPIAANGDDPVVTVDEEPVRTVVGDAPAEEDRR
jgi:hypothetical protein